MQSSVEIRLLQSKDIHLISASFQAIGWNKPVSQYEHYLSQQENGKRTVLVAFNNGSFAGYLTINWQPDYPPLQQHNIPEIQDFNVLPNFRRQGIGTSLMNEAETIVVQRSSAVGIGVGLDSDYGAAQRLYILRGYIPDGMGITYRNHFVKFGEQVIIDDDLVLHLIKTL
jgi:ribosomal protein S18 acetylase RimI-like enzyme